MKFTKFYPDQSLAIIDKIEKSWANNVGFATTINSIIINWVIDNTEPPLLDCTWCNELFSVHDMYSPDTCSEAHHNELVASKPGYPNLPKDKDRI